VYLLHSLRLTLFSFGGSGAWTGQSSGGSGTTRAQQLPHLLRLQLILASRSPTLRPSPAVLLYCHSTSREQLASCFIMPSPAPQHNPSASAGSYSSTSFLAQHPKNLPETLAPIVRNLLASRFIVPPSVPQYTPLALPLSSGTYSSGSSSGKHPENCVSNWKDFDNYYQRTTAFYHTASIRSQTGHKARFSHNISRMLSSTLPTKHQTNAPRIPRNK